MDNKIYIFYFFIFRCLTSNSASNFVLMGPPGAGKGTFADMLVQKYHYVQICPGALLREEAAKGTPLGLSIKTLVEQARPIESSIVCKVVQVHLIEAIKK